MVKVLTHFKNIGHTQNSDKPSEFMCVIHLRSFVGWTNQKLPGTLLAYETSDESVALETAKWFK